MAVHVYLGVRLPEKPYERVAIKNVCVSKKTIDLKLEAGQILQHPKEELEFIYCGQVLQDDHTLEQQGIRAGSTIHVFQKDIDEAPRDMTVTEADIEAAVMAYRKFALNNEISKVLRPEVIKKVLDEYPEFYKELGAFAILKDPILLSRIRDYEFGQKMAVSYPILIISAKFVVKTMNEYIKSTPLTIGPLSNNRDESSISSISSISSASEDESPVETPNRSDSIRRISRGQLATALMLAGSASLNSLSNLANNVGDTGIGEQAATQSPATPMNIDPPASTSPLTSTTQTPNRLTNSMFTNALSQALLNSARTQNTDETMSGTEPSDIVGGGLATPTIDENVIASTLAPQLQQYNSELYTMREMGLQDETSNLHALILCNGNVEAAINLVLAGMSGFP